MKFACGSRLPVLQSVALTLAALTLSTFSFAQSAPTGPLAILGIHSETNLLASKLTARKEVRLLRVPFYVGKLNGVRVVLARCGVGKVNAAMTTTLLIDHFHPRGIVFTGSAGALNPDLTPGDVVIGTKTAQHDYGVLTEAGMKRQPTEGIGMRDENPLYFPADPRLLKAARQAATTTTLDPVDLGDTKHQPRILDGIIITGDVFVASQANNDEMRKSLGADAVEEEGAAVAQVCWQEKTPFLAIRSISDNANSKTPINYDRFYKLAALNSGRLVVNIVACLK